MADEIIEEATYGPCLFVDDILIVICSESKERVEEKLESWRYVLERRGMKVNRRKTEYMCLNERQDHGGAQGKCKEKRWRKWMISNTWAQLYKLMERVEDKLIIKYRQDGMGGEECQEWSATGEYQLE